LGDNSQRAQQAKISPRWKEVLVLLKSFIDSGFGIWLPPAKLSDEEADAKWIEFQVEINNDLDLKELREQAEATETKVQSFVKALEDAQTEGGWACKNELNSIAKKLSVTAQDALRRTDELEKQLPRLRESTTKELSSIKDSVDADIQAI
jgi:hypothetical protein